MENKFLTSSGIEISRVYNQAGDAAPPPGEYPFTRGIHKDMYRGRLWTMRQYAGFGSSKETNKRFRWLLEQGQTGLSTAFDLPTQIGLDADDPKAAGEVGRVGVHIGALQDMEGLFEGIDLASVSTSLTINATAPVLLAFYVAAAKRRAVPLERLRGTLQNDILKEYLARGTYIFPLEPSLRLVTDTIVYANRHLPAFHPISISGYHIREAGSNAVQEIAFTFANAEAYIRRVLERGLPVDEFAPKLAFFFGCHNHFLEEIAKFRAARKLWARLMREDFGARDPKSCQLRFHVQTCGSTLTSQQPQNNVIRVALQAMAAVLGGCQSLHTNSYDEALALPSQKAAELALRSQQILAHETGIPDSVDPVAGSYAVEALTEDILRRADAALSQIRSMGGMTAAIAAGYPQKEIESEAYRSQKEVESGEKSVVGANCYKSEGRSKEQKIRLLKISPKIEAGQVKKLAAFKKRRDASKAGRALDALQKAASNQSENLFPYILASVENSASLGEIIGALKRVFGEYKA
ncbi:MAG: methylmalonyl-CoA mutase [Elusimicrobia bacterium]|nr:methylmalonyl-CoA mutase [Elusimicrobiota bacterium]